MVFPFLCSCLISLGASNFSPSASAWLPTIIFSPPILASAPLPGMRLKFWTSTWAPASWPNQAYAFVSGGKNYGAAFSNEYRSIINLVKYDIAVRCVYGVR